MSYKESYSVNCFSLWLWLHYNKTQNSCNCQNRTQKIKHQLVGQVAVIMNNYLGWWWVPPPPMEKTQGQIFEEKPLEKPTDA